MGKRGAKPKPRAEPRQPLSPRVPKGVVGRAGAIYRALAAELIVEGYACQADWRTVALTARTEAHAERLAEEVEDLEELTIETKTGTKVHPLLGELRAVRAQLANLYGALFLTPRARSSSRLAGDSSRQAGEKRDELGDFLGG